MKYILSLLLLCCSVQAQAACEQTLSHGANIASAVSSAAANTEICLNAGDYGAQNLWNINRTTPVTITSTTGRTARLSPQVGRSDNIRFKNMTLTSMLVDNLSNDIHITDSTFVPNQAGLALVDSNRVIVDNVDFSFVNQATWAGRLNLNNCTACVVKNSLISGVGTNPAQTNRAAADGIMLIGLTKNSVIGPGNTFTNIRQNVCDVANPGSHCDAIQMFGQGANNTITGNLFINVDTMIMAPDGGPGAIITDNVFNGCDNNSYVSRLQLSLVGTIFDHNHVLCNIRPDFDTKAVGNTPASATVRNNLMFNNNLGFKTSGGAGCNPCTFSNNANVIPVFVGGANPQVYSGFRLVAGSPGSNLSSTGGAVGVRFATTPSLSFVWDTSTSSNVGGYKLCWGTVSFASTGICPNIIDVGNVTNYTLQNLTANTTYYVALRTYNVGGTIESPALSNEVVGTTGNTNTLPILTETSVTPIISKNATNPAIIESQVLPAGTVCNTFTNVVAADAGTLALKPYAQNNLPLVNGKCSIDTAVAPYYPANVTGYFGITVTELGKKESFYSNVLVVDNTPLAPLAITATWELVDAATNTYRITPQVVGGKAPFAFCAAYFPLSNRSTVADPNGTMVTPVCQTTYTVSYSTFGLKQVNLSVRDGSTPAVTKTAVVNFTVFPPKTVSTTITAPSPARVWNPADGIISINLGQLDPAITHCYIAINGRPEIEYPKTDTFCKVPVTDVGAVSAIVSVGTKTATSWLVSPPTTMNFMTPNNCAQLP